MESIKETVSLKVSQRPRLIIDYMILENFKSYADKQKIGPFHTNFTSVVGPNGSGKSNLIEAMLFIFGFSASWMRMSKLNQLVHNSSTSTGNHMAAVQVHFKKIEENQDGSIKQLNNFQLWIRRTVTSSSVSKYYINGKDSTQAQIKQRLKEEDIDLTNNRFLILQGEVEQISQMKQKSGDPDNPGLLQYLEDIIGSNAFVERIDDCARQYAQAQQQKHEKGHLMKVVEDQLKVKSKAKDEAVKYAKKQKALFQLQNIYYQAIAALIQENIKIQNQKLKKLESNRDKIISQERQKLRNQADKLKQIKKKKAQIEELEKKVNIYQEQLTKMQVNDKHITQQIAFKSEDLVRSQRKFRQADIQMNKIILKCEEIKEHLPKNNSNIEKRLEELQEMRVQLSKYDKPYLKQKIKDCQVETAKIDLENNTIRTKLETLTEKLYKSKTGKDQLVEKINDYKKKIGQNLNNKQKVDKGRQNCLKMIHQLKEKVSKLNQRRNEIKNQVQHIENELRLQLNQSQEQGQKSNMFRQLMKQNIKGVIGRLGDLGSVSRQYDEIISTCCNKLDNIVCNDLETAHKVLDFLKSRQLGRVTCIIIDKIGQYRNYMSKSWQNMPKAVRLFDVIKFKTEEARLAFYFALGDTMYCQNSDLGLEYSMKNEQKRRRVISKNQRGYIIYEINGLMVGSVAKKGGFQVKAGINKKNKDQNELRGLEIRKKQLTQDMDEISKSIKSEQGKIAQFQKDQEQMKRELSVINDTIKQCEEQIKDLNSMLSKENGTTNNQQFLQKQIKALGQAQKQLLSKKKKLEQKIIEFQNEQKKNETEQIQVLREKYKKQKVQVSKLEKQIHNQKTQIETSINRIRDLKKNKEQYSKNEERIKRQIEKLKNEQTELQKKVSDILVKIKALQEGIQQCKKTEIQLKINMDKNDKEVKESKIIVERARKDVQVCNQLCKRLVKDKDFQQSQLKRIRLNYSELTSSFSFFNDMDEIQNMNLACNRGNIDNQEYNHNNSSIIDTSLLNSSMDSNSKIINQKQLIFKTQPNEDLSRDILDKFMTSTDKLKGMISTQTNTLKKMEGGGNLQLITEFREKYLHYKQRLRQYEAVRQRQQQLKNIINDLKSQRLTLFRQGFSLINSKLKEVYQHLTHGGDAQMELIDSLDPFSDGVNFSVRPPKKSWKEVNKLSGGQKTLSSLSLIFALHYYKPTPLYFMDQIDAALDFKNVGIVADYIKKRTKNAQFIIISLRNNMFDLADKLVGVYKVNDRTRTVKVTPAMIRRLNQEHHRNGRETYSIPGL